MLGALVLDILLTISAEAAELKNMRTLSLTCCVHARLIAKEERSTWVFTNGAQMC